MAGLGNPGQEYVYTRHNMGWAAIDRLVQERGLGNPVSKFRSEFWRDRDFILMKPLTWMNLSGLAIQEAFNFYKMELSQVLVICDEMALPYGQLRLRARGSAGGHNGLASVIASLGSLEVPRLRIGIGESKGSKTGWVLGRLSMDELEKLPDILENTLRAVEAWSTLDIERAMSRINVRVA